MTTNPQIDARLQALAADYQGVVDGTLGPLATAHDPSLLGARLPEYRKMVALSTKMTLVGHACTEIAGFEFEPARMRIAALFGGCCFLADSFLDDFGPEATRAYLARFERLLTTGWFDVGNPREQLFYAIVTRLFSRRDVLSPFLRQAILRLHKAQAEDVRLRLDPSALAMIPARARWDKLRRCARDRSGHAILTLASFLVPRLTMGTATLLFAAGALVMFIDDHGDCWTDRNDGRLTYMNQLRDPERALRRLFVSHCDRLTHGLPPTAGRDLLLGFLTRYYRTRIEKHRAQKRHGGSAWDVYA